MAKYFKFVKEQVQKMRYQNNGRIALKIIDESEGYRETVAIATVNLPDEPLEPDEVFIKDWSENEGVLKDLIAMGIISKPIGSVRTEFCVAHKCKLLI
jgi:hypothetical protein